MVLDVQDMELIEARAELIAERVVEKVVTRVLTTHVQTCPHGRFLFASRRLLIGIGVGVVAVSVGSSTAIAMVIKVLL